MLSQKTLQMFRKYIEEFVKLENEVENRREQLANNIYFEPYTVFSRLDCKKILHLDINDIKKFCSENDLKDNDNNLSLMFRKLDIDKDQYISFSEFSRYILPHRDQQLNYLVNNRQSYHFPENNLPILIQNQLMQVFLAEIELNKRMYNQIQQLKIQPDWNTKVIWESLSSCKKCDIKILQEFIDQSQLIYNIKDLENFIYRNSKERDSRINYSDFLYLIYANEEENKNYTFCTPQKIKKQIYEQKSKLQPQTNFRTDESTNIKSDKLNQNKQSQSHHHEGQKYDEVEVSEFRINENDNEDQNILEVLLNKLKIQNKIKGVVLKQLFLQIDENKKGFITLEDLMNYFKNQLNQPQQIEELIRLTQLLDKNKDGIISEKEFCEQIFSHMYIKQI